MEHVKFYTELRGCPRKKYLISTVFNFNLKKNITWNCQMWCVGIGHIKQYKFYKSMMRKYWKVDCTLLILLVGLMERENCICSSSSSICNQMKSIFLLRKSIDDWSHQRRESFKKIKESNNLFKRSFYIASLHGLKSHCMLTNTVHTVSTNYLMLKIHIWTYLLPHGEANCVLLTGKITG